MLLAFFKWPNPCFNSRLPFYVTFILWLQDNGVNYEDFHVHDNYYIDEEVVDRFDNNDDDEYPVDTEHPVDHQNRKEENDCFISLYHNNL